MKELIIKFGIERVTKNSNNMIRVTKNSKSITEEEVRILKTKKQHIINYLEDLEERLINEVVEGKRKVEVSPLGVASIENSPEELDVFDSVIVERANRIKREKKEQEEAKVALEKAKRTGKPVQIRTEVTNASLDGCIVWAMPDGKIEKVKYYV